MNLDFTEEQEMLRKMARDFLEKECPKTLVKEMEKDEKGYPPELWRKMADLGWMGIVFPEQYGGTGGTFLDLTIIIDEMGRACLPGPFFSTVVLCGLPILNAGNEEQKKQFLSKIASGEAVLALALTEPSASYEAKTISTRAVSDGDNYIITGTKLFVSDAHVADYLLCVTRTREAKESEDGITLFLVDAKSPGITCTPLVTTAYDKQAEVVFDKVKVPARNILGKLDQGWAIVDKLLEQAAVAKCAEMVGGAQQVLEMSVAYAKERVQYEKPIGSFQVIQHYLANMWMDIEGAVNITYETAWKESEGLPCAMEAAATKAWVNEAYKNTVRKGLQIHGAMGVTADCDIGLYFRRAKAAELVFGDTDFQQHKIACQLGL